MKIRIPEPTSWRADGSRLFAFGEYRVPEDMSQEIAELAVSEGAASVVEEGESPSVKPKRLKQASPPG